MRSRKVKKTASKSSLYWYAIIAVMLILVALIIVIVMQKNGLFSKVQQPIEQIPEVVIERPIKEEQPAVPAPEVDENGYIKNQTLPKEPTYINGILIASKRYPMPADFAPGEQPEAKEAKDKMLADAKKAGFILDAFSGYRSYDYQKTLYENYVARDGQDAADRYSARPGYSEHQTGLVYDIGEVGKESLWLTETFGETEAGRWLRDHAHHYGFIMRYPQGKEDITGYMYESWHFRYVGVEVATTIFEQQSTLEEYLGVQ